MAVSVVDVQVNSQGAVRALNQLNAAAKGAAATVTSLVQTLGAGFALQQIIRTTSQFESVLGEIGKTAGASEKDIAKLAASLKDLSAPSKTNLAPTVLAEGVKDLVAQGLKLNDAVASMETLGKVAVATNSELTDVTKTGFQLQSALKIRPNELKATFDALAFAGKAGAFELKDMAQFMPTIASAATSLGIKGKDGAVALAAMMQMVRKDAPGAAEASTRLTDALLKMTAPETVKNFKKFGVDIEKVLKDAVAKGVNPMDAAITQLIRVTGKDQFKLSQIFGDKEAKLALQALMKYRDEYEKLKAAAGGAAAAGTVQKDFEASLKTFNGQLSTLQTSGELLALSLGRTLLPVLSRFIEELVPLANSIATFVEGIGQLPKPVLEGVVELTKLVIQITLLKKGIALVVGAVNLFKGAMALMAAQTTLAGAAALTGNAKLAMLSGGITGTGRAAAIAAPLVSTLAATLKALGAIGVVTVGINYVSNAVGQAMTLRELQQRRERGGAAAAFAGATRETVIQSQAQQSKNLIKLKQQEKQRQKNISPLFQIPVVGPLALAAMSPGMVAEQQGIQEKALFAKGVLGLDPSKFKSAATPDLDSTVTGPGVDPLAGKEKKGKKGRDSQLAQIEAANGLFRAQEAIQARIFAAEQARNTTEVLRLQGVQRGVELLFEADEIQRSGIPLDEQRAKLRGLQDRFLSSSNKTQQDITKFEKESREGYPAYLQSIASAGAGFSQNLVIVKELTEQQKQQQQLADSISNTIGTGMTSAFDALIKGSQDFGESLRQIASGVLIDIAKQLIQILIIEQAISAIRNLLNPAAGAGSFLPNVKFNPAAFSGINLRANGGSVMAGQGYLVGERGPELFMPGRSGGIAPAGGFGSGVQVGSVNITVQNTGENLSPGAQKQIASQVQGIVMATLVNQKRSGGIL